ncbi:MAG: hypothetical protein U0X87_09470 [Anaerolineales bacterium]
MCAKQSPGYPTRGLQVWANADYPKDAQRARSYGAVRNRSLPHGAYVLRAGALAHRAGYDPLRHKRRDAQPR